MAVTEKLVLFYYGDYGGIEEADDASYFDVTLTFMNVEEVVDAQAMCRFTIAVSGVLLNRLYRPGMAYEEAEPSEVEAALIADLSALYGSATAAA